VLLSAALHHWLCSVQFKSLMIGLTPLRYYASRHHCNPEQHAGRTYAAICSVCLFVFLRSVLMLTTLYALLSEQPCMHAQPCMQGRVSLHVFLLKSCYI
jgi:hypothetical protein